MRRNSGMVFPLPLMGRVDGSSDPTGWGVFVHSPLPVSLCSTTSPLKGEGKCRAAMEAHHGA